MAGEAEAEVRTARWKKGREAKRESQEERKPMVDEKGMGLGRAQSFVGLVGLIAVIRGSDEAAVVESRTHSDKANE